ncbi:MAG: hypothetical protein C4289_16710 [Chloroflexota bacterium]
MLLIDALIHAFHQSLTSAVPHCAAAANLIESNHRQVVALLDRLAYADASTTGLKEQYLEWQVKMQQMQQLRLGGRAERER